MRGCKRLARVLASVPVGLPLAVLLAVAEIFHILATARIAAARKTGKGRGAPDTAVTAFPAGASRSEGISVIMLNWNGRSLLDESLPPLQAALRRSPVPAEVIIVDNGSSDDSVSFVRENFPDFRLLPLPANVGFGEGNNAGVRAAAHDLVLLLNNDILVQPDFLEPLLRGMGPNTFAVTSQIFLPPGARREETGKTVARFRNGLLELSHEPISAADEANQFVQVLWAGGGSSLYRRTLFLALGGFDRLYSPSYAEDADLSFRAWQSGYASVLAVESHVLHKHRSSARKRFGQAGVERLMQRQIRLFFLRNFSLAALLRYLCWLPANSWAGSELASLLDTLPCWGWILARRIARRPQRVREREILQRAATPVPDWVLEETGRTAGQVDPLRARGAGVLAETEAAAAPTVARAPGGRQLATGALFSPSPGRSRQRPLRILYVSAYTPHLWRHGGAGRVFQLVRRVAQRHQVSVATFYENDFERNECEKLRPFCHSVTAVYRRGKPAFNIFPYEPFREFDLPEMHQVLRELAQQTAFDLVHFEYTQMACYAYLFPTAATFLTEVEVNYGAAASKVRYCSNPVRRVKRYYNALQVLQRELELCRKVGHVVCVTETDADLLRGYLPRQEIHVVPTGVDLDYFTAAANGAEEPLSMGFVAAFRHEPNVDAALFFVREVLPRIKKKLPAARLYLIGSSPPPEVQRLHNGDDVVVTGFVEDLLHYYRRISLVLVPVRTGVGIRGKILEAWAAGRPVVGTSLAAAGISASQGENICIADGAEELAQGTVRLLEDPAARRRLAEEGRKTVERLYDWNRLTQQLCQLYQDALRQRRGEPS
ncbi:MAG: glycosyltransferase [Acidobacteria bacterium]|nr:glycosyltransferase [Acidobacteriota bacterium]